MGVPILLALQFRMEVSDGWFGPDKVKHAAVSYVLCSVSRREGRNGWAVSISVGLGKEIYDGFFRRGFSYRDLVWDLVGVGLASLLSR